MKLKAAFQACSSDYFGYVNPSIMMRTINEGVAIGNHADGVGFDQIYPSIGATWMLGQCVMEFLKPVYPATEVEIETGGHEQFGAATVRRSTMYSNGEAVMRFATKTLPVYYQQRKVVPPEAMAPFWKTEPLPCGAPISFIQLPEQMKLAETYQVAYRDCDLNKHMTAFRYLDLILENIGYWDHEMHLAERIQIDYKKEVLAGETLKILVGQSDGIWYCSGEKADGQVSFNATVKMSDTVIAPPDNFFL